MNEKKNYVDMEGMQDRVDAKHKEHLDKVWGKVKNDSEKVVKRNQEVQALLGKALQQEVDTKEAKVIAEMEVEKAKAIKEIEEKYGTKRAKLQAVKQEDADSDLKEMLRNINQRKCLLFF